jgi:hypothetical protein
MIDESDEEIISPLLYQEHGDDLFIFDNEQQPKPNKKKIKRKKKKKTKKERICQKCHEPVKGHRRKGHKLYHSDDENEEEEKIKTLSLNPTPESQIKKPLITQNVLNGLDMVLLDNNINKKKLTNENIKMKDKNNSPPKQNIKLKLTIPNLKNVEDNKTGKKRKRNKTNPINKDLTKKRKINPINDGLTEIRKIKESYKTHKSIMSTNIKISTECMNNINVLKDFMNNNQRYKNYYMKWFNQNESIFMENEKLENMLSCLIKFNEILKKEQKHIEEYYKKDCCVNCSDIVSEYNEFQKPCRCKNSKVCTKCAIEIGIKHNGFVCPTCNHKGFY